MSNVDGNFAPPITQYVNVYVHDDDDDGEHHGERKALMCIISI